MDQSADIVRAALLRALADVEGVSLEELTEAVNAVGDSAYELDSKQAEVVIAALEVELGLALAGPAALENHQYNTVAALIDLVSASVMEAVA